MSDETPRLRFQGRVVFCSDVRATAEAFRDALDFEYDYASDGDVSLRAPVDGHPDASIEIYLHPAAGQRTADHLGVFGVDDVDAAIAALERAGFIVTEPAVDQPWGVREADLADADRHTVTLSGPVS